MPKAGALLFALIVVGTMFVGCAGSTYDGGYHDGGGGGYYPSTYSITIRSAKPYTLDWYLVPYGSSYAESSGYLYGGHRTTLSGLSGTYDLDIYYAGSYLGSYYVNGSGTYVLSTGKVKLGEIVITNGKGEFTL